MATSLKNYGFLTGQNCKYWDNLKLEKPTSTSQTSR